MIWFAPIGRSSTIGADFEQFWRKSLHDGWIEGQLPFHAQIPYGHKASSHNFM